jgi:hypothetical protein
MANINSLRLKHAVHFMLICDISLNILDVRITASFVYATSYACVVVICIDNRP